MKERIQQLLQQQQLSPSRLAEALGVQPSSISHLLSGRNKPSFDFLEKVLQRFPDLNPDWLILGSGAMYRQNTFTNPIAIDSRPDLFQTEKAAAAQSAPTTFPQTAPVTEKKSTTEFPLSRVSDKPIERIVVFYTDKTFIEYTPE